MFCWRVSNADLCVIADEERGGDGVHFWDRGQAAVLSVSGTSKCGGGSTLDISEAVQCGPRNIIIVTACTFGFFCQYA